MPMVHRYSLLLVAVAFYYAQAFIPIMSLDVPDNAMTFAPIAALSWLSGYSPHPYHYLTIGLMPFIFSGLFMQLMQWQLKPLHERFASDPVSADKTRRFLVYIFASLSATFYVSQMQNEWFSYHPIITWFEFVLTIYCLETLFNMIKPLKVVGNPITLFLGLNVLGSIAGQLTNVTWLELKNSELAVFSGAVTIGFLFIILALRVEKWNTALFFNKAVNTRPSNIVHKVPVKVMRVGMMPIIYAGFIFYPVMMMISPVEGTTGQVLLSDWYYAPALLCMLYVITKALLGLHTPIDNMVDYARHEALYMVGGDAEHNNLKALLGRMLKRHAAITTAWFGLVLFTEALWQVISPDVFTKLGFVGGIGIVILVGSSKDVVKHYFKLKEEVRYV
jgi:preprotein translocase subunit SecY|tara:strand:- start:4406 stop:5575 length:1170 start_codon:yes stop_codon:yes gene_type:complete